MSSDAATDASRIQSMEERIKKLEALLAGKEMELREKDKQLKRIQELQIKLENMQQAQKDSYQQIKQ